MRRCAETLLAALGASGPILVYSSYERRVIRELAARFADLSAALLALCERIVDLHPPVKANYYHPQMMGSWSLKAVLPTVAPELAYDTLGEVQDGGAAQAAYLEAIRPETSAERRAEIEQALKAYCRMDTLGLARLVAVLAKRS